MENKKVSLRARLLAKSKEALETAMIPFREKKDKHSLKGWILDRESEYADLELKLEEMYSHKELEIDDILNAEDALEIKNVRINQGKVLYTKLFDETE